MIQFLVALVLCYVLIKIPFWILGSLRGGGGRSFVGGLVRGFIAYKTFGLLKGMGGAGGGKSTRSRGGQKSPESRDPYATTRATSNGQSMLPLNVKRVRKPAQQRPTPQRSSRSRPAQQGKQLELPLDGEWPENKPRLGRDGQYQLPLNVQRQPKPKPVPKPPPERKSLTGPRGRQMPFPSDGEWPENKPLVGRDGQYRLSIEVQRVRRPAPPPDPPKPTRSGRGRQTKLPADGEWPENKPRGGRDGQYRLPLNVQRTRKPARGQPQPPPPPQRSGPRQQELPLNLPKLHPPRPSTGRKGGDRK